MRDLRRTCALAALAAFAGGCISKAEDGSTVIDLRGCQAAPKEAPAPPLGDGPVMLETAPQGTTAASGKSPVVAALAWRHRGQEAVRLALSTSELRCSDLSLSPRGGFSVSGHTGRVAAIVLAPVLIDVPVDQKAHAWSIVPEAETWRVVRLSQPEGFWSGRSASDPARGVDAKGKRTKLRVTAAGEPHGLAGALDVEGCGEVDASRAARPQPDLALRFGERRVPILGATYTRLDDGGYELRLTSAPGDCDGADAGDVDVIVRRDTLALLGDAFPTAFNYSGHGLHVELEQAVGRDGGGEDAGDGRAGDARTARLVVRGVVRRPMVADSAPRSELERRSYERQVHIGGRADALVCPNRAR